MNVLNKVCLWIVIAIMTAALMRRLARRSGGPTGLTLQGFFGRYAAHRRKEGDHTGGQDCKLARNSGRDEEEQDRVELDSRAVAGKGFYIAVSVILYGLIAIRCIGFGSIPGGFNQDGAMGAVDALALANYGTDRFGNWLPAHFQAWGFGQMSVLLSYLTVPFIRLWGLNSVTARLPMLLASIAGAIALYGLVRDIFGRRAGMLALLCVAVSPWHYMQSRWALDCNMFPHMFILGLFFLNKGLNKELKKSRYLYLSMVFFALCMYSYGVAFYMVPVFLTAACALLLLLRKVNGKQVLAAMAVYFGLSWPIYGTMLINFMGWETVSLPFTTMAYFPDSIRSGDIVFFSEQPLTQLWSNAQTLWRQVFLQKPDLLWNAMDDFGTMYHCSLPLVLAGAGITVYYAIRGEKDKRIPCLLLLIYWVTAIMTGLFINYVNINRINIIFYCHLAFAGIAIYAAIREWKRLAAGFAAVYGLLLILFLNQYFTDWAERMETCFFADFLEAVEYAGDLEADYYYITPDSQSDGSWWVSQILTMYAVKMDAEYFQGKTDVFRGAEISYADRYHFSHAEGNLIQDNANIVYVVRADRIGDYAPERFARRQFGDYYVVMPWLYSRSLIRN